MRTVRPVRVEGDVAYVTLTKGFVATIDAAKAGFVGQWNWQAQVNGNTVYAVRTDRSDGTQRCVLMHRAVLGAVGETLVDHIDGDGLNCRTANLRRATRAQNQHNRRAQMGVIGLKGVTKHHGKWRASIKADGAHHHLGYYATPESAHAAYAAASARLHGEFGRAV